MTENKNTYFEQVLTANSVEELSEIKADATRDKNISKDDLDSLISEIDKKVNLITNKNEVEFTKYDTFKEFDLSVKSWSTENTKNLPYHKWLLDYGIPKYYPLPYADIQNKLFAICCFINSASIPARSPKARKEAELPILYFCGQSGSGKSEGCSIISLHYYPSTYRITSADSTGVSLRNDLHNICTYSGFNHGSNNPNLAILNPAFMEINNFEPKWIDLKWGEHKTLIYSVLRSQAISSTGHSEESGVNKVYFTQALKAITSVIHPKVISTSLSEFYRRLFFIFTEKCENFRSISRLDFSDVPLWWNKELWGNSNKKRWYGCLKHYLGMDSIDVPLQSKYLPQSIVFLAMGKFLGYWKTDVEAFDHLIAYWELVKVQEESYIDDISILVEEFIDKERTLAYYDYSKIHRSKLGNGSSNGTANGELPFKVPDDFQIYKIESEELIQSVDQQALTTKKGNISQAVVDYLLYKGWRKKRQDGQWIFVRD